MRFCFLLFVLVALTGGVNSVVVKQVELPDPLDIETEDSEEEPWNEVERELNEVEEASTPEIEVEGKCPCVKLPGSSECFVFNYDKGQMAETLEEALVNFKDPNSDLLGLDEDRVLDEDVREQLLESNPNLAPRRRTRLGGSGGRESEETKEKKKGCCQKIISSLTNFANNLNSENLRNSTLSRARRLRKQCKIQMKDKDYRKQCKKQNGKKKHFRGTANYVDMIPELYSAEEDTEEAEETEEIVNALRRGVNGKRVPKLCASHSPPLKGKKCRKALRKRDRAQRKIKNKKDKRCKKRKCKANKKGKNRRRNGSKGRRGKRQASDSGESWPADCRYRRGSDLDDDETYVGFCNLCWSWRILDDKYYPSFLNELSCDSDDGGCLAGWGECRPRWRSIEVMYNSGDEANPRWSRQSMSIQVACECRIKTGSPLHNFVAQ